MKRAVLVSTGTLAGLVAVLTYSGADTPAAIAAGPADSAGLGGPPPLSSTDPGTAAPSADPSGAASGASSPGATPSTSTPAAATKPATKPTTKAAVPATTKAATPTKAAAPTPTKAAVPTPKPTPKPTPPAGPKDYTGSMITHKYGRVQVGIRVQNGKIIAVWPVVYPNGPSQPYSDFSIPILKSETLKAQGPAINNVSGATLTWQAWKTSLQSAMHKAGL